jgi:OmpA-OmpF porin, OOP family
VNTEIFDNLAHDVAERFGLSTDKARQLMGVLIALIFDHKRGGFAGFASLFHQKGLGSLVQSWISTGSNQSISQAQVESVFGAPLLGAIAGKLGVDRFLTASAISAVLPGLVNELTVGGKAPASIPETLKSWVVSVGDWLGDLGNVGWGALSAGAAAVGGAVAGGARAMGNAADTTAHAVEKSGSGLGKLLMWLLLAAALIGAFLFFKSCKKDAATPPAETAGMPMETTAPVAQANPRFGFENVDGKAMISGQVASDAEKSKLMDAITAAFGAGNVSGDITVDTNTAPAGWLDKLIAMLPDLKASGVKLGFDGDKVNIDTSALPEAERFALSQKLRTAFGGFEITGLWDKALAAFAALKPGASADDLVKALNLSSIYFDTDSATITRDSLETLTKAAEAIKLAPAGTRIEVGGHTDNTGDAAANMHLSLNRANAVTAKLVELGVDGAMLSGKGYGQNKPIAENATEEGRAQNRRMEFVVIK